MIPMLMGQVDAKIEELQAFKAVLEKAEKLLA